MKQTLFALAVLLCSCAVGAAQSVSVRPSVSVVGEAEMLIEPNQVVFTFEVVSTDTVLAKAKAENDEASARTLTAARTFNIATEDLQTDSLTIAPRYSRETTSSGPRIVLGYEVTKRILITLKSLDKIDAFVAKVIEAGVNRVAGVSIENSDLTRYQEQVRAMAVRNARERAASYAKQLGQSVGRAYVIREENGDFPGYTQGSGSGSGDGMGAGDSGPVGLEEPTAFSRAITFALGKIKVEETIYVTFELK